MRQLNRPLSTNYHASRARRHRDWKAARAAGVRFVCRFCRRPLAQRGVVKTRRAGFRVGRPREWTICSACLSIVDAFLAEMEATTPHRANMPPEDLNRKEL